MNIDYFVNKLKYNIEFCPDKESIKINKKKKSSYTSIAKDLKKKYSDQKVLLVADSNIDKKITKYLIHDLKISFPKINILYIQGEKKNKNIKVLFEILDKFFDKRFIKKSILISMGGGVVGDVCGLASSLYLRGLMHFHIPTTMTSIIDSCIGGKTGINYKGAINSIGTYYHPKKVYISKNIIDLLPQREYLAGIPEIIKCGLIKNNPILKMLQNKKNYLKRNFNFLSKVIRHTLLTKIHFFKNDFYEEGKRLNLNFGHTFAHAIEMALDKKNKVDKIRHGEAVGIGILCEIFYANGRNKDFYLTKSLLEKYNLPINLKRLVKNENMNILKKKIFKNIFLDKKRINKYPRYVYLKSAGKTKIIEMKDFKKIKQTIQKIIF